MSTASNNTRSYNDYDRKRLRVGCIRLDLQQNSTVIQDLRERLQQWDRDNPTDSAHNHIPDQATAKYLLDPNNTARRKELCMAYRTNGENGQTANDNDEEVEEAGEDDTAVVQGQGNERQSNLGTQGLKSSWRKRPSSSHVRQESQASTRAVTREKPARRKTADENQPAGGLHPEQSSRIPQAIARPPPLWTTGNLQGCRSSNARVREVAHRGATGDVRIHSPRAV
jgi:hypothetical protein